VCIFRADVSKVEIARRLGISRTSVRRILATPDPRKRRRVGIVLIRSQERLCRQNPTRKSIPGHWNAIDQRCLLRLRYRDKERIVEPHDYGVHNGIVKLFTYQVGRRQQRKASPLAMDRDRPGL
jgi:hypothetical protein